MDKTIEKGHNIMKMEVTLEEEILEEGKITEVEILGEDIDIGLGMIILAEVEGGLEKDSILIT